MRLSDDGSGGGMAIMGHRYDGLRGLDAVLRNAGALFAFSLLMAACGGQCATTHHPVRRYLSPGCTRTNFAGPSGLSLLPPSRAWLARRSAGASGTRTQDLGPNRGRATRPEAHLTSGPRARLQRGLTDPSRRAASWLQ